MTDDDRPNPPAKRVAGVVWNSTTCFVCDNEIEQLDGRHAVVLADHSFAHASCAAALDVIEMEVWGVALDPSTPMTQYIRLLCVSQQQKRRIVLAHPALRPMVAIRGHEDSVFVDFGSWSTLEGTPLDHFPRDSVVMRVWDGIALRCELFECATCGRRDLLEHMEGDIIGEGLKYCVEHVPHKTQ